MNRVLTVKQVNRYISGVFEDELILHDIMVSGEIFEFKVSGSSTFIVLKEDDNILECYKFGKTENFEKGAKVTLRGKIRYYPRGGKVSLTFSDIKYSGEGLLHAEFLRLKAKLQAEGLFDNKNTLPVFISKVALITSVDGAVIHDIGSVIAKSHSYIKISPFDVSVQGTNAVNEIVAAIAEINAIAEADVIVIARGGGSYQDLQPFNSEEIARAVFKSKIPIISAVGHETDYTLCDFSSVLRAPTPSIAAESIVRINQQYLSRIRELTTRLHDIAQHRLNQRISYVSSLTRKLAERNELSLRRQENKLGGMLKEICQKLERQQLRNRQEISRQANKLTYAAQKQLVDREKSYHVYNTKLDALSPLRLLSGGYARIMDGKDAVRSIKQIQPNKILKVVLCDGTFRVKTLESNDSIKE